MSLLIDRNMTSSLTLCVVLSQLAVFFVSQVSGKCPAGFYGPGCHRRCKSHCFNNECYLLPSGRAAHCVRGCEKGWTNPTCSIKCRAGCLQCAQTDGGDCVGPCKDRFYGPRCTLFCPGNCTKCNQDTGRCEHVCMPWFYGDFCSKKCSCEKCDRESGTCLHQNVISADNDNNLSVETDSLEEDQYWLIDGDQDRASDSARQDYALDSEGAGAADPAYGEAELSETPLPPQIIAVIIVVSIGAVLLLIAVPLFTMDRFALCKRKDRSYMRGTEARSIQTEEGCPLYEDIQNPTRMNLSGRFSPVMRQ